jgi:hypothetical protein
MPHTNLTAQAIDDVLAGTFPASDPPAWTQGIARLVPSNAPRTPTANTDRDDPSDARPSDVTDMPRRRHSDPTFGKVLVSLFGAVGLALLVPLALVVVGVAVALPIRLLYEGAAWMLALLR